LRRARRSRGAGCGSLRREAPKARGRTRCSWRDDTRLPALSQQPFLLHLGEALEHLAGGGLAAGEGVLLFVVLGERTERRAKLEYRDLAACARADANGHHRRAEAGTDVDG